MGKGTRTHRKAGLIFPSHIVRKLMKTRAPGKRMQKHVEIILTSVAEKVIATIITEAAGHCDGEATRLKSVHLYKALQDPNSKVSGFLRQKIGGIYSVRQAPQTLASSEPQDA